MDRCRTSQNKCKPEKNCCRPSQSCCAQNRKSTSECCKPNISFCMSPEPPKPFLPRCNYVPKPSCCPKPSSPECCYVPKPSCCPKPSFPECCYIPKPSCCSKPSFPECCYIPKPSGSPRLRKDCSCDIDDFDLLCLDALEKQGMMMGNDADCTCGKKQCKRKSENFFCQPQLTPRCCLNNDKPTNSTCCCNKCRSSYDNGSGIRSSNKSQCRDFEEGFNSFQNNDSSSFWNCANNKAPPCSCYTSFGSDRLPTNYQTFMDDIPTPSMTFMAGRAPSPNRSTIFPPTIESLRTLEQSNTIYFPRRYESGGGSISPERMSHQRESLLIEDTYNPGLIEDSVECNKDFNAVSFGLFFESLQQIPKELPPKTPMSLIEAFWKRIEWERRHVLEATCSPKGNQKPTLETIKEYFSHKPPTELNTALSNLYKAEVLYEEQKMKSGNQVTGEEPYIMQIQKNEQPLVGGSPITAETYLGITIPIKYVSKKDKKL